MSICSSGVSQKKSGAEDDIYLTSAAVSSILSVVAPELAWLEPFVGYVASSIVLHLPTFCAIDPPADPGLTGADLLQLVALGPGPLTAGASDRMRQLIERFAWYQFCECASVTTPAPPTPPGAPTGTPSINPPAFVPPTGVTPCFSGDLASPDLGTFPRFLDFTWDGANPTTYVVSMTTADIGVGDSPDFILFLQETIDGPFGANSFGTHTEHIAVGDTAAFVWTHLVGGLDAHFELTSDEGTGVLNSAQIHVDVYCNGEQPGGSTVPCCPPDTIATGLLQQILATVTLLQRQLVPFAYIAAAAHSGLTGSGSISVQGILGVHAALSVPDSYSLVDGTPAVRLDPGRINFGTADGYVDRVRLVMGDQLAFPAAAGVYTTIGYSLGPGVSMDLTELVREP